MVAEELELIARVDRRSWMVRLPGKNGSLPHFNVVFPLSVELASLLICSDVSKEMLLEASAREKAFEVLTRRSTA